MVDTFPSEDIGGASKTAIEWVDVDAKSYEDIKKFTIGELNELKWETGFQKARYRNMRPYDNGWRDNVAPDNTDTNGMETGENAPSIAFFLKNFQSKNLTIDWINSNTITDPYQAVVFLYRVLGYTKQDWTPLDIKQNTVAKKVAWAIDTFYATWAYQNKNYGKDLPQSKYLDKTWADTTGAADAIIGWLTLSWLMIDTAGLTWNVSENSNGFTEIANGDIITKYKDGIIIEKVTDNRTTKITETYTNGNLDKKVTVNWTKTTTETYTNGNLDKKVTVDWTKTTTETYTNSIIDKKVTVDWTKTTTETYTNWKIDKKVTVDGNTTITETYTNSIIDKKVTVNWSNKKTEYYDIQWELEKTITIENGEIEILNKNWAETWTLSEEEFSDLTELEKAMVVEKISSYTNKKNKPYKVIWTIEKWATPAVPQRFNIDFTTAALNTKNNTMIEFKNKNGGSRIRINIKNINIKNWIIDEWVEIWDIYKKGERNTIERSH